MKKVIYIWMVIGVTLFISFSSCSDYLNYDYIFKDELSVDSLFMKREYSEQWLANVYAKLETGENVIVASKGHQPFNFLADDMYYGDRDNGYEWFKRGDYNEGSVQSSWGACYMGIRDASTFIHYIDRNQEMTADEIIYNKAQARFLRAYYYWLLLRKYGPIPILPDEGLDYTLDYDDLAISRSTYEECAEYIAKEMALAAQDLPVDIPNNREVARPTRGAALAVRARAYLYAASPLFNGNKEAWAQKLVDDNGQPLLNMDYKEELWGKAAAAAQEVIDLGKYKLHTAPVREFDESVSYPKTIKPPHHDIYSKADYPNGWANIDPFESYRQVFNGALSVYSNEELIFSRGVNTNTEDIQIMVLHQVPRSMNGWNTHGVTLKHASTYYMKDGKDFYAYGKADPREGRPDYGFTENADDHRPLGKDVSLEYADREPRFYASIAYNGSVWEYENAPENENLRNKQVFYYRGGQDGRLSSAPGFYLRTGIGIKKFYHPRDYFNGGQGFTGEQKVDIDIRYAEVLLIHAEALNELKGSYTFPDYEGKGSITVSRDVAKMSSSMKLIRLRAGLPDFEPEIYADADDFRIALKRERQIELFAETHRYYDLRRWKDVAKEETMQVWGCNMTMTDRTEEQKKLFHIPTVIPSLPTVFSDKMYLWPISHSELKRNRKLTQNPGWTYYD